MEHPKPDLAALYLKHRETLLRVAAADLSRSALRSEYEDVVHDVFVKLQRGLPDGVSNWEAYLVTCVRNAVKDRLRGKDEKRREGSETEWEQVPDFHDSLAEVDDEADLLRQVEAVMDAIGVLSSQEWDVLQRRFIRGDAAVAVARDLGLSPGRISQIQKAALSKVRREVEGRNKK